jgi:hypothetical protein
MAKLAVQRIEFLGLNPRYTPVSAGGDTFPLYEKMFLHVKNASGSPVTITIQAPGTVEGLRILPLEVTVPPGEERMIGSFSSSIYSDTLTVSYSDPASVTIAAFRLPTR